MWESWETQANFRAWRCEEGVAAEEQSQETQVKCKDKDHTEKAQQEHDYKQSVVATALAVEMSLRGTRYCLFCDYVDLLYCCVIF